MKKVLVLCGHFGSGFRIFQSGFHFTLQYGFIHQDGTFDVDEHREITEISKEDMIQLAAMLLAEVFD